MSESYTELLIKRKPAFALVVVKALLLGLTGACFVMTLFGNPFTLFGVVIFGFIFWFVRGKTDLEYEYLYLSGELSVDKIINRQKRKASITMPMEKVELVAPTDSEKLNEYKNKSLKKLDFTSRSFSALALSIIISACACASEMIFSASAFADTSIASA